MPVNYVENNPRNDDKDISHPNQRDIYSGNFERKKKENTMKSTKVANAIESNGELLMIYLRGRVRWSS